MFSNTQRLTSLAALLVSSVVVEPRASHADMVDRKVIDIDFTIARTARDRGNWTGSKTASLTSEGLVWQRNIDFHNLSWFQTAPIAIGWAWRPVNKVQVRATIRPTRGRRHTYSGRDAIDPAGTLFVRYSADLLHWSSWLTIQRDENRPLGQKIAEDGYQADVQVPGVELQEYSQLLAEYGSRDVPWVNDEDAAVRWMVSRNPGFFAKHIPIIGYMQFMFEPRFFTNEPVRHFHATITYSAGGLQQLPKAGHHADYNSIWHYRANSARGVRLFEGPPSRQNVGTQKRPQAP
jgi:hypothetical protein